MAKDLFVTVAQCTSCTLNIIHHRQMRRLELLSAKGTLEFVAKDILGSLPNNLQVNQ